MVKLVLENQNKIVRPLFGAAFVLCLVSFHVYLSSADISKNLLFKKNSFRDTIRVSNSTVWILIRPDIISGSKLFAKVISRGHLTSHY